MDITSSLEFSMIKQPTDIIACHLTDQLSNSFLTFSKFTVEIHYSL